MTQRRLPHSPRPRGYQSHYPASALLTLLPMTPASRAVPAPARLSSKPSTVAGRGARGSHPRPGSPGRWCQGMSKASCAPEGAEVLYTCAITRSGRATAASPLVQPALGSGMSLEVGCCLHQAAGAGGAEGQGRRCSSTQQKKKKISLICWQLQPPQMCASMPGGQTGWEGC